MTLSLADLRARVLSGAPLTDDEVVAAVRALAAARQERVANARSKSRTVRVDLDGLMAGANAAPARGAPLDAD